MGQESQHLPCRTCRSITSHELSEPATTARGMTTELWACTVCGTLESRSYRSAGAVTEAGAAPLRSDTGS